MASKIRESAALIEAEASEELGAQLIERLEG